MINRKAALVAVGTCIAIGILLYAHDYHYRRYTWPADIQTKVLGGTQITDGATLVSWESDSVVYGEGGFKWTFRLNVRNDHLKRLCGAQPVLKCKFTRSRHLSDGVDLFVEYADGILIIEEAWS